MLTNMGKYGQIWAMINNLSYPEQSTPIGGWERSWRQQTLQKLSPRLTQRTRRRRKLVAPILKAASGNKFFPRGLGRVGAFFSGVHQWVKVLWELGRGRFWHRQHQTKSSLGEGQLIEPPIHLSHNIHFYISFSLRLFSQKHCDGSVWGDQHDGACLSDPLLLAHPRGNNNHDHNDQNGVPVIFT